jgi:hypothetical protein
LAFRHARHLLRDRHIKGSILKAPSATMSLRATVFPFRTGMQAIMV